jgi:hypothetical protein
MATFVNPFTDVKWAANLTFEVLTFGAYTSLGTDEGTSEK